MQLRTAVGAAVLAAALSFPLAGVAAAQTVTCSSFTSQAAAQIVYNQNRADPNGLDRDKDGTACEPGTDGVLGNGEGTGPTTVVNPTVVYPTRGVETGAGGTAGEPRALPESSESGGGGIALLAGGAAVLVAGGVVLVRRRVARRNG